MTKEIENYKTDGFTGFIPVSKLRGNTALIPDAGGVYIVVRDNDSAPEFLAVGTGGFFKKKNPNVEIAILEASYVSDSQVVYIGKAGTSLRERLSQLLRFGAGSAIGHRGGRYLWQLADAEDLLIAWKVIPEEDPRSIERRMLLNFISIHGKLPFANLSK